MRILLDTNVVLDVDNLQMVCAEIAQLDAIVTRDPDDFKTSAVSAMTPTQILARLN